MAESAVLQLNEDWWAVYIHFHSVSIRSQSCLLEVMDRFGLNGLAEVRTYVGMQVEASQSAE